MRRWNQWQGKLGGLAVYTFVRQWMSTLDYQALLYDPAVDPAGEGFQPSMIYVFWHEYIPCAFYLRPHCDIAVLLSRHRDADWLCEAARHMGYHTIRGSTWRGGDAALRQLARASRTLNLGITPDGPRGPRRCLAPGCVFLASKLNRPLVPLAIGYDRPWRMPTWDRFALPRPYSRARVVMGPPLTIPPDLDRENLEWHRQYVETVLNQLTDEAEQWAESGQRRRGQILFHSKAKPASSPYHTRDDSSRISIRLA